jgi:predicted transcriptional regulator
LIILGDQKVFVHLTITIQNNPHTIDELKTAITEYIRNVDRAVLNTVFENAVRRVNKCLETGGGQFEHYL